MSNVYMIAAIPFAIVVIAIVAIYIGIELGKMLEGD